MKKYFCFVFAVVFLILVSAACGKKPQQKPDVSNPSSNDFEYETEAPDSRLPAFKGDIKKLMTNYYIEVEYEGNKIWAAGIDGNFYLSDPELAGLSVQQNNVFSKTSSASVYNYLYEYYELLKEETYSVKTVSENSDEIIGRKAHKVVFSSPYGDAGAYYLDAEYGFCLKQESASGRTVFEVKNIKIGDVKYEELEWEEAPIYTYTTDKSATTKKAEPTMVIVHSETTAKEPATIK